MRWDYKVDGGGAELKYIVWSVENKTTGRSRTILFEDIKTGTVNISTRIPQMYVGRVKKTGRATFVIKNLIYEDSGKYTLTLDQRFGQDPGSLVELVITGTGFRLFYIFMLHIKQGFQCLNSVTCIYEEVARTKLKHDQCPPPINMNSALTATKQLPNMCTLYGIACSIAQY